MKGLGADADPAKVDAMASEIAAEIQASAAAGVTPPQAPNTQTPIQGMSVEQLQSLIQAEVKPIQDLLAKERAEKEAAQQALAAQQKTEHAAKVKSMLDKAVAEGKIAPTNAELLKSLEAMATSDYAGAERLLSTMPATVKPSPTMVKPDDKGAQQHAAVPGATGDAIRAAAAEAYNNKLAIN